MFFVLHNLYTSFLECLSDIFSCYYPPLFQTVFILGTEPFLYSLCLYLLIPIRRFIFPTSKIMQTTYLRYIVKCLLNIGEFPIPFLTGYIEILKKGMIKKASIPCVLKQDIRPRHKVLYRFSQRYYLTINLI
jgi:hypothetical protein